MKSYPMRFGYIGSRAFIAVGVAVMGCLGATKVLGQIEVWVPPVTTEVWHDGWSEDVWVPPVMGTRHVDEVSHVEHVAEQSHVVHHDEVSHVVHHDEVSHVEHHDAVYDVIHHDLEIGVEHIDEQSHMEHHEAETHTEVVEGYYDQYWVDVYETICDEYCDWVGGDEYSEGGWDCWYDCHDEWVDGYLEQGDWVEGYEYEVVDQEAYDEQVIDVEEHDEYYLISPEYNEYVVVEEAWDETIVDQAGYDETIIDQAASDQTVVDVPAHDVTIVDVEAHDESVVLVEGHHETVEHEGWSETIVIVPGHWENAAPISKRVAGRDSSIASWNSALSSPLGEPIYAGDGTGDMVEWTINDLLPGVYSWSATGPYFTNAVTVPLTISGPAGENIKSWQVLNEVDRVLDWAPGTYKIKCHIQYPWGATRDVEYEQMVGWGTRRYLVVGQVRPIADYFLTASQQNVLRADLANDIQSIINPLSVAIGHPEIAAAVNAVLPGLTVEEMMPLWLVVNAPNVVPSFLRVAQLPNTTTEMKLWMLQQELNQNPDLVDLRGQTILDSARLIQLTSQQAYRMLSEYQVKFIPSNDGRLDNVVSVGTPTSWTGGTKLSLPTIGITIADYLGLENNGVQLLIPGVDNPANGAQHVDKVGGRVSLYTSGRIGWEASGGNYALLERDVPYIFDEIVFSVDNTRRDRNNVIPLSINRNWSANGVGAGIIHFNEISI